MPSEDVIVFLRAQTGEFQAKMRQAAGETDKFGGRAKQTFNKTAALGKAAFLGIAGAAIGVGTIAVKMAGDFEVSHARLVTALENTNTSFAKQKQAIDAVEKSGEGLGFNHAQIEDSLAIMTRGMGSSAKAIGVLGIAEDLARAKGIDLAEAATIVTKASEGQLRPLKALAIDLPVAAGGALKTKTALGQLAKAQDGLKAALDRVHSGHMKAAAAHALLAKAIVKVHDAQLKLNSVTHSGSDIIAALGAKLDGSAARAADTFHGKVEALHAKLTDLLVAIGQKLIPILEKLASALLVGVHWLEKHRQAATALAAVLGGALAVALAAYIAKMAIAAAETIAATWPILAVAAACAALVVAVMYLWNNWDKVWGWIKNHKALAAIIAILVPIVPALIAIVVAAHYLYDNWSKIWDSIKNITMGVIEWFHLLPGRILDAITAIPGLVWGVFAHAWGTVRTKLPGLLIQVTAIIATLPIKILFALADLAVTLEGIFLRAFVSLISKLPGFAYGVLMFFLQLPGRLADLVASFGSMLVSKFSSAFLFLLKALPGFIVKILGWFASLPDTIIAFIGDVAGKMFSVGQNIIRGIINGVGSMAGQLGQAIIDQLPGPVKGTLGAVLGLGGSSQDFNTAVHGRRFGGPRAAGGPVMAGLTYLVGEHGPEMFVPRGSGSITPNNALGAAQLQPIHITLEVAGKVLTRVVVDESNRQGGLPIRIRVPS